MRENPGHGRDDPFVRFRRRIVNEDKNMWQIDRSRWGRVVSVWMGLALLSLAAPGPSQAQTDPRVLEIIDQVDRLMRGESSRGNVRMEIDTENWSRTLEMEIWSLGTDHSLVRVASPAREARLLTS